MYLGTSLQVCMFPEAMITLMTRYCMRLNLLKQHDLRTQRLVNHAPSPNALFRDTTTSTVDYHPQPSLLDLKQKQLLQNWRTPVGTESEDVQAQPLSSKQQDAQDGETLSATRSMELPDETQVQQSE